MNTKERIEQIVKDYPLLKQAYKDALKLELEALVIQAQIEQLKQQKL